MIKYSKQLKGIRTTREKMWGVYIELGLNFQMSFESFCKLQLNNKYLK